MMKYRLDFFFFFFKAESYHGFKSCKKHRKINTLSFLTSTALTWSHRPALYEATFLTHRAYMPQLRVVEEF